MASWSILVSVLFTIWFLLLDRHIIIQISGYTVESSDENFDENFIPTTEISTVLNDNVPIENWTETFATTEQPESSDDDVIELNVGGQKITTLRSTLTAVPKSKLALMFNKNNTDIRLPRDKQGAIVFDYNPVHFNYLLDQLRTIKRTPRIPSYELDFQPPTADIRANFSYMVSDLGLLPEQFLFPRTNVHLNLSVNTLVGWQECYRSRYDTPFDIGSPTMFCTSTRILVACQSSYNKKVLTVAGVGKLQDLLRPCSSISNCPTVLKNGTSFYYVANQAWGFEGRPQNFSSTYGSYNRYHSNNVYGSSQNACDASDQYSEYRLCWSLRSIYNRGGGDRCGSAKNLHNSSNWERIIYKAV